MPRKTPVITCIVFALWLTTVGAGLAQTPIWQAPDLIADLPAAPWREGEDSTAAIAPGGDIETLEVRVADDTFIASKYPFDWKYFGNLTSVWFGSDPDLGHVRALLRWDLPPLPSGGEYAGAAVYLPVAGQNEARDLSVTAFRITSGWGEGKWNGQPTVSPEPLAQFTVGTEAKWYWFDVGGLIQDWYHGAVPNYGIELRGPETTQRTLKGTRFQSVLVIC